MLYLQKNNTVEAGYILVQLAGILMLIMPVHEVYFLLQLLIQNTKKIFSEKRQDALRWHIPLDQKSFQKTVSTYLTAYMQGVTFGERSLLVYCRDNHFDFTQLVDSGFRTLMTNYLNLDNMTDLILVFLSEGQKSLFRYLYAILKIHKDFIKNNKDMLA